MISGDEVSVGTLVVQDETEHTSEVVDHVEGRAVFGVKRKDYFAIGSRHRSVWGFEGRIKLLKVVDLSIGSYDNVSVSGNKRLRSRFRVHDSETLMADSVSKRDAAGFIGLDDLVSRPIRSTMTKLLRA